MSVSVPAQGVFAEVEHPTSGHVWHPTVVDLQRRPTTNGYPRLDITVPKADRWQRLVENNPDQTIPFRVWKDGQREPVGELETVRDTEQATVLQGRGGLDLDDRVRRDVNFEYVDVLADDIITNDTPYTANVDTPQAQTLTNANVASANSQTELEDNTPAHPFASDSPLRITSGGTLTTYESGLFRRAENFDTNNNWSQFFADRFENGEAYRSNAIGTDIQWDITTDYTIPSGDLDFAFRLGYQGNTNPAFEIQFGGEQVLSTSADSDFGGSDNGPRWFTATSSYSSDFSGTQTLRIDITGAANDNSYLYCDCVAVYDTRYTISIVDDNLSSGGLLSWPNLHPDAISVETNDYGTFRAVTGGKYALTIDDTSNNQAVGVSNDGGGTYTENQNSTSVETDFAAPSTRVRGRVTLSYYDDGSGKVGPNAGQAVDAWDLDADLNERPYVADATLDGSVAAVLNEIADPNDFYWQYRRSGGTESIEMTRPGLRTSDRKEPVAQFEREITTEGKYDKVTVKGSAQRVREEQFTANHGTAVDLAEDDLQIGREVVWDPSDGSEFVLNTDYELDAQDGTITTLTTGGMTDGQSYKITYWHRPAGSSTINNPPADPREAVERLPVATDRGAGQAALQIRKQVDAPLKEGRLIVPADAVGWKLLEEIDPEVLPGSGPYDIRSAEATPDNYILELATRPSIEDTVSSLQDQLTGISGRI